MSRLTHTHRVWPHHVLACAAHVASEEREAGTRKLREREPVLSGVTFPGRPAESHTDRARCSGRAAEIGSAAGLGFNANIGWSGPANVSPHPTSTAAVLLCCAWWRLRHQNEGPFCRRPTVAVWVGGALTRQQDPSSSLS